MKLEITPYETTPISFNYDELKREVQEKAELYTSIVYTPVTLADAREKRAELNKFKKRLSDARISISKEYREPLIEFETKMKEIEQIISNASDSIGSQINDFDDDMKQEKKLKIEKLWDSKDHPGWFPLYAFFNEKWLNKSYTMAKIESELDEKCELIKADIRTIENLECSYEAFVQYKKCFRLQEAIVVGQEMLETQKRKEEEELQLAMQDGKEIYHLVLELTKEEGRNLREYLNTHNIKHRFERSE